MGSASERQKLSAVLGLAFGLSASVGGTIGVGILRTPGLVAERAGGVGPALLVWLLGAAYVLLGVNYTAELATTIRRSGGPYAFAERTLGRFGGLLVGWTDFLNSIYAVAFLAVALGEYVQALAGTHLPGAWLTAPIILAFTAINMAGVRAGSGTQQLTSLIKFLALVTFVLLCLIFAATSPAPARSGIGQSTSILGLLAAFQLVLGVYSGWRTPAYFAEEARDSKAVVRALFGGAIVVALVYVAVNAALVAVLPYSVLIESKLPAAAAADRFATAWGLGGGATIVTILAVLSLPSTVQSVLMATSRSLYAMAQDGFFFRAAARVNRSGSPGIALATSGAVALVVGVTSSFEQLFVAFALFGVFNNVLMIVGTLRLRFTEPGLERPYRAFLYPWSMLAMLAIDVALLVSFVLTDPYQILFLAGVSILLYAVHRRIRKEAPATA